MREGPLAAAKRRWTQPDKIRQLARPIRRQRQHRQQHPQCRPTHLYPGAEFDGTQKAHEDWPPPPSMTGE
jgi:hypothetical protein